jgi:hypothetical protein
MPLSTAKLSWISTWKSSTTFDKLSEVYAIMCCTSLKFYGIISVCVRTDIPGVHPGSAPTILVWVMLRI